MSCVSDHQNNAGVTLLLDYELVDFGKGRKLERFGSLMLDRISPAADDSRPLSPTSWKRADSRYQRTSGTDGKWSMQLDPWQINHASDDCEFALELRTTDFGHIGVFAEQMENWNWIAQRVKRCTEPPRVLNLFGYTGAATLAAASAGAEVTHVDASKSAVQWARHNAQLSALADKPIRWIVEDAAKFVRREVKRGNSYDAVILDPPSYGHGPKGEVWKLSTHLMPLLIYLSELTNRRLQFLLMTCHSPGFGPAELQAYALDAFFQSCQAGGSGQQLFLKTPNGHRLHSGSCLRWPG